MKNGKRVVVLGAGITGVAAAYRLAKLGYDVHVIEREKTPGGTCRSFKSEGFTLDYGPHKFYTLVEGVLDEVKKIMGDEFIVREKKQSLYMDGRYFDFPLRMGQMLTKFSLLKSFRILLSYGIQILKNPILRKELRSYADFITARFGKGLYEQIFAPMARKIYGAPESLDKRLAEVRISSPGLVSVIKQTLLGQSSKELSAQEFHYPKGGFGRLPERFTEEATRLGAQFHLGATLTEIHTEGTGVKAVSYKDESGQLHRIETDYMVYTIPVSFLKDLIPGLSDEVKKSCEGTRFRNVVIQYYLLKSEPILPSMWVFFPEEQFRFGRLSEMTKFSNEAAPPGHTALMVDFTCTDDDPHWKMTDDELDAAIYPQLKKLGLFERSAVIKTFTRRVRNFYPIYDVGFQNRLSKIRALEKQMGNLFFIGRLGDFNYNNSDQCVDMGFKVAEQIHSHGEANNLWEELRAARFENYRIVD